MIYECPKCGKAKSNEIMGSVLPQCLCDWQSRIPKRTWEGLTLEEIWDSTHSLTRIQKDDWVATDADIVEFAHIIEARLKAKNT